MKQGEHFAAMWLRRPGQERERCFDYPYLLCFASLSYSLFSLFVLLVQVCTTKFGSRTTPSPDELGTELSFVLSRRIAPPINVAKCSFDK